MKLWVDDKKVCPEPCEFITARTYDEAIACATKYSFEALFLDFDLGLDPHNGLDVLQYLVEHDICPPVVHFITFNPVGRKRMVDYWNSVKDGYITELERLRQQLEGR